MQINNIVSYLSPFNLLLTPNVLGGRSRGIMVKVLDCSLKGSKFRLQLSCYVHFQTNILGKGINSLIPPGVG